MNDEPTNVWQFLLICFAWMSGRTTRILGLLQGSVAILVMQDTLIPKRLLPWLMGAIALLTYWRGSSTSKVYANAQAIVKQNSETKL